MWKDSLISSIMYLFFSAYLYESLKLPQLIRDVHHGAGAASLLNSHRGNGNILFFEYIEKLNGSG